MPRFRRLVVAGAVVAALVATLLVALPHLVGALAVRQLSSLTGRRVSIADVDLNLFTRHLVVRDVRLLDAGARAPVVSVDRVDARFQFWSLLRGRIDLDAAAVAAPVVRLRRDDRGRLDVADIVERVLAAPAGEPRRFAIGRILVERGRVVFEDHQASPPYTWEVAPITLEVVDVGTEVANGRARLTLATAGARVDVELADISVRPFRTRFGVTVAGFDVGVLNGYLGGDGRLVVSGRLGTRAHGRYSAADGLRASAQLELTDLALARPGENAAFVAAPALTLSAAEIAWARGVTTAGRLELTGAVTVVDATATPPARFELTPVRVLVEDASHPAPEPARVTVAVGLPDGGTVDARGTAMPYPVSTDLAVTVAGLSVALARPWVPPDATITVERGTVAATLRLRYDAPAALSVDGDFTVADIALGRRGQSETFIRDALVRGTVADVTVRGREIAAGTVTLTGTPTVVDTSRGTAQRFELARFVARASDLTWPSRAAALVTVEAALAGGGTSSLRGSIRPDTLAAGVRATFSDVDLTRFTPYLPADAPLALGGGRVAATADMTHDPARGVRIDGQATVGDLVLLRRGQAAPLLTDPSLDVALTGLVVKDGTVSAERVTLAGTPEVLEASGTRPERFDFASLTVTAEDVEWPPRRAMSVHANGRLGDGATSTLEGSLHLPTLAAAARATFTGVDLTRLNGYLPATAAVAVSGGRLTSMVTLTHDRTRGVLLNGSGFIAGLGLTRRGRQEPFVTDDRLAFAVDDLLLKDSLFTARRLIAGGAPVLTDDSVTPSRRISIPSLTIVTDAVAWPTQAPSHLRVEARLPEAGSLTATGAVDVDARIVTAKLDVRDAAVDPFASFLPVSTDVRGRLDATLDLRGGFGRDPEIEARGVVRARAIALGTAPHVSVGELEARQLHVTWPRSVTVEGLTLRRPSALVERAADGSFPLRAMLRPPSDRRAAATAPPEAAAASPEPRGEDALREPFAFSVATVTIEDGDVRFVDRTTRPFYSEEITDLDLTLRGLTNVGHRPAQLVLNGVVGGHAALDLKGVVSPFATPFRLDVAGELRDFPVSRTNPYLQRLLDWVARSGRVTTRVHYRITGDELHATNEIVVQRLDLEPASTSPDRLVGLPLGLVVSLLKDTRGDIRLTVPIEGRLSAPRFSFGGAVRTALRNVLTRLVTAPFRAIGGIFQRGTDGEVEVRVDPLVFAAGSAALTPEGAKHLQRVADFLRSSPHVRLGLAVVVTERDLTALRAQSVTARIQRLQRRLGIQDFDEAARRLFAESRPGQAMPKTSAEVIAALANALPETDRLADRLVTRRLATVRQALIDAAGIEPERVVPVEGSAILGAPGEGRIEFKLLPA